MLTKRFCRYTEAFPQPFTIRVTTPPRASEQILAVLNVHPTAAEPIRNGQVRGLRLTDGSHRETILFRPVAATGESSADSIAFMARATAVGTDDGRLQTWLVQRGTRLRDGDRTLLAADVPVDASADYAPPAAAAQFWIGHEGPARIRLHLPARPRTLWAAAAHQPEKGRMLAVAWANGVASVELAGQGATVLWVDPARDLASPPPALAGLLRIGQEDHELPFETAVADNGETVAFATVTPAVPGVYRLTAPGAELLVSGPLGSRPQRPRHRERARAMARGNRDLRPLPAP